MIIQIDPPNSYFHIHCVKQEREKNKDRILYLLKHGWKIKDQSQRHSSVQDRINQSTSNKIYQSIKKNRPWLWEDLLGYSLKTFKVHIQKKFTPGMSWTNYGEWHIDHIVPKSIFCYESSKNPEFRQCWGLKNLRPMWARENIRKRNKLIKNLQLWFRF